MRIVFSIILLILSAPIFCQIEANAFLDKKSMRLGEQTTFTIEVNLSDSITIEDVQLPNIEKTINVFRADTLMAVELEVIESYTDTAFDNNSNVLSFQKKYIITSWDTGVFMIDSMKIAFHDTFVNTNSTYLHIGDVPVDTTKDIVDIKDILSEKSSSDEAEAETGWFEKNWIWLVIIFSLLIAGIAGWFFYFRKEKEVIEIKPKLPAHQIALQRLSSLKKKDLIKKGKEKEYYSEITEIIRVYLGDRYNVHALELTTNEIINRLKFENVSPDHKFSLKEILETADLVKFAKVKPSEMDNENSLFKAEEFVRNTKYVPQPENQDEE
jgi:LPXTG-motif cell wall-anchored protein